MAALRMTESARADAIDDIVDDIVRAVVHAGRNVVQLEIRARNPGNDVIRARRIAADSNASNDLTRRVIQRKSAAEHIDAADLSADHRIARRPIRRRIAAVGNKSVYRVAFLQTEQ